MGFKHDAIAAVGEFVVSTTLFLFLALGGAKTAQVSRSATQLETSTSLGNETIMFISVSFGLSLLITAWCFYRITGGLFNPAITLALYLVGAVPWIRAIMLTIAQLLGGMAGAGLVSILTPFGGTGNVQTKLQPGINHAQGLMIEAFLTAILVFSVLMLAAEKHKSTYLAPIGIGLTIFACHLFGVLWTGCGINPARAIGPSVVAREFPSYFWIYVLGPFIGSVMAVLFYAMLKAMDYTQIVFGQDADHVVGDESNAVEAAEKGEANGGDDDPETKRPSNTRSSTTKSKKTKTSKKLVLRRDKAKEMGRESGVTVEGNDLSTVVAQEWVLSDEEQQEAIRNGDAVIIEMDTLRDVVTEQLETGFPSMAPYAQDAGGIQAPGTVVIGIAAIDNARQQYSRK